jgi:hypothetical protein
MAERETDKRLIERTEASLQHELEEIYERRGQRRLTIFKVAFGVLALFALGAFIGIVRNLRPSFLDPFTVGSEAEINTSTMLAVDDDAFSVMLDLQTNDDQAGLNLMLRNGHAFSLTEGTRILIIERELGSFLVRATEGRNAGMTG